jgi:hypothetical protein
MDSYFSWRGGFGDLPARLSARPCIIAYLGASVTVQRDGYRPRLHEWLVQSTGQPHRAVNAALGAVGSMTAVFTMDELVLRHRPDLCFVEYSSGDIESQSPLSQLGPALEGIVRKLLDADCQPAFLYLYRFDRSFDPPDAVISTYERVAEHYSLPSINAGQELERALRAGEDRREVLFVDGIHTTGAGSERVSGLLTSALSGMFAAAATREHCTARRTAEPLYERSYRQTRIVAAEPAMLRHPERCTLGTLRFFHRYVEIDSDNQLDCAVDGEIAGLLVVVGGESGVIRICTPSIEREQLLWDETCYYDRLSAIIFDPPLPPRTPLSIRLTDLPVDYSRCVRPLGDSASIRKNLKVVGFMVRQ